MRLRTLLFVGFLGAAAAYLFDPIAGRERRARLRDQAKARVRESGRRTAARGRYALHAAEGQVAEMRSPGPDRVEVDDATLAQRIRSEVFGQAAVPDDRIALDVVDGVATLRGELDADEQIEGITRRVRSVPGVVDVVVLLRRHGEPPPNKEAALEASREAAQRDEGKASRSFG